MSEPITSQQLAAWKSLVNACKGNYQRSINVGSDKYRAIIIAIDNLLESSCKCADYELPEHNPLCPRYSHLTPQQRGLAS